MSARPQRFFLSIAALALVGAGALPSAQVAPAQVPVAAGVFSQDVYPAVQATFPGGVTSIPDVTYTTVGGFRRLKLDLYLPPASAPRPYPTVVYTHGGGWSGGTPRTTGAYENWPAVLASLAARGYVVASLQYRLSGEAPFPAQIQDLKAAIRWLRTNAATYGIDGTRFLSWGPSAGGHLAGLAATSCGVEALAPPAPAGRGGRGAAPATATVAPVSECVQASVMWYGVVHLRQALNPPAEGRGGGPNEFLGCTPPNCAEQVRAMSVTTYVDPTDPPMLLLHGSDDETVSVTQAEELHALLKSRGVRSELVVYPGIGHSWIGKTPEATRDTSRAALEKTFAFIAETVGRRQ